MPSPPDPGARSAVAAPPPAPRLFLIDGYALVYRAFYALIARPLTTRHGENTSAAWGIVNFLERLRASHRPDYLVWVNDSGKSFRQSNTMSQWQQTTSSSATTTTNNVLLRKVPVSDSLDRGHGNRPSGSDRTRTF